MTAHQEAAQICVYMSQASDAAVERTCKIRLLKELNVETTKYVNQIRPLFVNQVVHCTIDRNGYGGGQPAIKGMAHAHGLKRKGFEKKRTLPFATSVTMFMWPEPAQEEWTRTRKAWAPPCTVQ